MIDLDFQTDPDFPSWAAEPSPSAMAAQEMMMRQNHVADVLQGFPVTRITDRDGRVFEGLLREVGVADPSTAIEQWELRRGLKNEVTVRAGTVTGAGMAGYPPGMEPGADIRLGTAPLSLWLRVTFSAEGVPREYAVSPSGVETIWVPSAAIDGVAAFAAARFDWEPPPPQDPTVNLNTGAPAKKGVYHFRIGGVLADASPPSNDYLGPLGFTWCAPSSGYLHTLT